MSAQRVCGVDDIAVNAALRVEIDGLGIAIVKDSVGEIHALGDACSHGDISLSDGFVEEDGIECWAHGSKFDLVTGTPRNLPAYEPVPVFAVEIRDGDVYVDPSAKLAVTE